MATNGGNDPGTSPGPGEARAGEPFAYDVFISYAHLDNEPLFEGEPGWISDFHAVLEKRLGMLLGEPARIWRDPELRGNQYFDQTIARGFENAALFLSVLTPRYVRSDYCRKELEGFQQRAEAQGSLGLGDRSRILKVVKTPVDLPEQPPPMERLLGYEFFRLDPEKKRLHELHIRSAEDRERFLASLEDLAAEIREALRLLKGRGLGGTAAVPGTVAAAVPGTSAEPERTVYLAPPSSDRKEEHEALRRELAARGYTVLPNRPLPLEAEELASAVRQDLERCRLSIHILGSRYGLIPEGAERSAVEIQAELASERGQGTPPLRRVFWLPPGLPIQDARQQALLDRLRNDPAALGNAAFLETSLEELKAVSLDRLEQIRKEAEKEKAASAPAAAADAGEDGPRWVYLMHTPRDAEEVTPWVDFLWEQGFEVRTPLFEGSESEVREEHESNLQVCDGFLLYFGQGNERWLRKILLDLKKAQGMGRTRPVLAKAIWMAPPESPEKARFRTLEAEVLRGGDSPSAEALRPFLEPLGR